MAESKDWGKVGSYLSPTEVETNIKDTCVMETMQNKKHSNGTEGS